MARSVKRPRAAPQAFHELGKQGRKTGITLQDRGVRDEHGMQPLDSIFSPHEAKPASSDPDSDDSESVEMSIASSTGPGPQTLLKHRNSITYPIPKSKSPIKTKLNSPAKRNPHLEHLSSPSRGTLTPVQDATVTRKLDFAVHSNKPKQPSSKGASNGLRPPRASLHHAEDHEADLPTDPILGGQNDPTMSDMVEQSLQLVNAMHSDNFTVAGFDTGLEELPPAEANDELPEEPELPPAKPSPARVPSHEPQRQMKSPMRPVPSIFKGQKRSPLDKVAERDEAEQDHEERQDKRQRTSMPPPPKPAATASRPVTAAVVSRPKPRVVKPESKPVRRGRGRPKKSEQRPKPVAADDDDDGDETIMEIQRGPPMPRARGLVSLRNDSGFDAQARSGRRSVPPMQHWRGEQGHYWAPEGEEGEGDEDSMATVLARRAADANGDDSSLSEVREVVRLPEDAPPSRRAPRSKTRTKARSTASIRDAVQEDEELEDWEINEGVVTGDIVIWESGHAVDTPKDHDEVQLTEDQLAISADAIQTQDIPNATFRFAKTLTLPFMGAGVVDLPTGAEKMLKNSRKMHMVFFVHYGKVLVTINQKSFRISAGGTWFVPRGNYYCIVNDYEVPARIFFAQGCEVVQEAPPEE